MTEVVNDWGDNTSMVREMSGYNQAVQQHNEDIQGRFDTKIKLLQSQARAEAKAPLSESAIQGYAGTLATGQKAVRQVYSGAKAVGGYTNYLKAGGRTGEETDLGLSAVKKGVGILRAGGTQAVKRAFGVGFKPGAISPEQASRSLVDTPTEALAPEETSVSASPELSSAVEGASQESSSIGGSTSAAAEGGSTTGDVVKAGTKAGAGAADAVGDVSKLSKAGDALGTVGTGLGIVAGAASGIEDLAQGKIVGDDTGERIGNVANIVGGALDAASLALPVLAPLGALAGVVGGIASLFGEESESKKKTNEAAKAPPKPVGTMGDTAAISTLSSVGGLTSASTDTLHTITGQSSSY